MQGNNGVPIETDRDLLIKLATDVRYIRTTIDEIKESLSEHDEKISKLEQWRAYVLGFAIAVSFVLSVILRCI